MNDPFAVLGVSQNATDEQIRQAYRLQARRFQEQIDANVNVEYARQKMQELDNAYDAVILSRSGGYQSAGSDSFFSSSSDYADIRQKIRSGRLDDAGMLLDGVPGESRSAEWYFLKGSIQRRQGWLEEAAGNFAAACRMDPGNTEYRAAYDEIRQSQTGGYRTARGASGGKGIGACDICSGLICADCCCECMGGDLIRCC